MKISIKYIFPSVVIKKFQPQTFKMKRFTASNSLISPKVRLQSCDSSPLEHMSANIQRQQHKELRNKNLSASCNNNYHNSFKVPLQSASSGYFSLDDSESDASKLFTTQYKLAKIANKTEDRRLPAM